MSAQSGVNKIKTAAGLPKKFRPLHGLRHAYASMLASYDEGKYGDVRLISIYKAVMNDRVEAVFDHFPEI